MPLRNITAPLSPRSIGLSRIEHIFAEKLLASPLTDNSATIPSQMVFVLALAIGIVAGLRSLTAPAVVAWAAHLNWLNLHDSPLAFMASTAAVVIFSVLAFGELISDKLPSTSKRTAPAPLVARIVTGGLCGACLCASTGQSLVVGV